MNKKSLILLISILLLSLVVLSSTSYAIYNGQFTNSAGGKLDISPGVSSHSDLKDRSYQQETPKISYDKHDISLDIDRLKLGENGGGFTAIGLVRDSNGYLYMAYNYPIYNQYKGENSGDDWTGKAETVKYPGYTLTFGVGVAVSLDNGVSWQFVAKNEDSHAVKGPRFLKQTIIKEEDKETCLESKKKKMESLIRDIDGLKKSKTGVYNQKSIKDLPKLEEELEKTKLVDCEKLATKLVYFYENDLSEVDFHGIALNPKGGVDVYYSLFYRDRRGYVGERIRGGNSAYQDIFKQVNDRVIIRFPTELKDKKPYEDLENSYEFHAIHIDGTVPNDQVISEKAQDYINNNIRFVGASEDKHFFVEGDSLYYSEDGRNLKIYGNKGFIEKTTKKDRSGKETTETKIVQMSVYIENGKIGNDILIIGYYDGKLYKSQGGSFTEIKPIGTESQRKSLSLLDRASSYPFMKFDSSGNLHLIIKDKSLGIGITKGSLYYQFIPAKIFNPDKDPKINTVYFFYPSSCTKKCAEFRKFLADNGITAIENSNDQEFKLFRDSNQIVIVAKKEGAYNTIYGLNKIKVAKYLGIEIKPLFIDNFKSLIRNKQPSDEIDAGGYLYFTSDSSPAFVFETEQGINQYYYSLEGWNKEKIAGIDTKDYPVRSPDYRISEPYVLFAEGNDKIDFLVFNSKKPGGIKYDNSESPNYDEDKSAEEQQKYGKWSNHNWHSKQLVFETIPNIIWSKLYSSYASRVENIKIWTNKFKGNALKDHDDQEYPYFINYYDFYSTKSYSPPSASATATQLIPGAVMYIPLDDQKVDGKVVGQLAEYVSEEGEVVEDGERFYRVKVDISKKIKAKDDKINEKQIKGFLKVESGYSTFTLRIINKPLSFIDLQNPKNSFYLSSQAVKDKKNKWIVANNLAVPNIICGKEIAPNSYKIFQSNEVDNNFLGCIKPKQSSYEQTGYCNDWDRIKNNIGKRVISSYHQSLKGVLQRVAGKINYEQYYGQDPSTTTYITFRSDPTVKKDAVISCQIATAGMDVVLVRISTKIFGKPTEILNPEFNIMQV